MSDTFTESNVNSYKNQLNSKLIRQNQLKYLIENHFETEFKLLIKVIDRCGSPVVFSHNDFGFNNILVRNKTETEINERVIPSDFEFSSYGFRGRDFGLIYDDWLHFNHMSYHRDSYSLIEPLLKSYLSESIKIKGKTFAENPMNSLQHLIFESKLFLLLSKLFYVLFHLNADQTIFKHMTKLQIMVIYLFIKI